MKRRVKVQPSNPYYSNEPAVSRSMIADQGNIQNSSLANKTPKMVDKNPGRLSGLAGFESKSKPKSPGAHISTPKLGTKAKNPPQQGSLRMSGHSGAHRIGNLKSPKLKV